MTISTDLLREYDRPGPRYTSYPTAPAWREDFGPDDYAARLDAARNRADDGLSVYVHIPFCERLCVYCGCSTVITRRLERGEPYVDRVLREAELVHSRLGGARPVVQHHWGGGTPTFLPPDELARLFEGLNALFPVAREAEVSIEVDPRVTSSEQLETLRRVGFNRVSMGVQDFDPTVQKAINRIQPYELTRDLVRAARELGFESVNLDLVYGLPHQRLESFRDSVERTLGLEPDRVACYGYAHVPWLRKHQRAIPEDALPRGGDKLALYLSALEAFSMAGYASIGMDHFARRGDALGTAADRGVLHRNFQGYTTFAAVDLVGFGVTAISEVDGAFAQNHKQLSAWEEAIDAGRLPTERGLKRSADDEARRRIILDLMCRFRLDFDDHGGREDFTLRYGDALAQLRALATDGLVAIDDGGITVTETGRLLVRNAAMPFDAYLSAAKPDQPMYSRTV